jgi:hypothetical protein
MCQIPGIASAHSMTMRPDLGLARLLDDAFLSYRLRYL